MPAPPSFPLSARILSVLVPVVFLGLCAARNLPWRLADYDQAKQAFVSLEMTLGGDPFYQHTPGERRLATKPPLVGWVSAGTHALLPKMNGDAWELAWRLPSLLATAILSGLLWRTGRALWPAGGGWLALGMFGLNLTAPRLATLVRTDMVLALWTTAAGLLVWHRRRVGGTWTTGERWALGGVVTAAMLTKGPILYAFLLPGLAGLWAWEHFRAGGARAVVPADPGADAVAETPRARRRVPLQVPVWPWLLPLGVFAVWVVVGCQTVPGFYEQVVGREFLGRFDLSERPVHAHQPVYVYVGWLFGRMAPWSLLLLATAAFARPAWRVVGREPAGRWLIAWTVGGLVLMSLVPSKRPDRIFPVVPPLCLLLTAVVGRSRETSPDHPPRIETLAAWTTAAALVVATVATVYETRKAHRRNVDALDCFGRQVRHLTAARGWPQPPPMAVGTRIKESDDTLIACLRQRRWLKSDAAAEAWRTGRTDALILQTTTLTELAPTLGTEGTDYTVEARTEAAARKKDAPYLLIQRVSRGTTNAARS